LHPNPPHSKSTPSEYFRSLLVLLIAVANTMPAAAQLAIDRDCGRAGRPWVSVAFGGQAWTAERERSVLEDLRAGLRLKGIDACRLGSEGGEPPLALLELEAVEQERVSVGIEVHDALTEKRVSRDLDLRRVAEDARPLAIAAAADELLRASWAELALSDAPAPSRPPPPEVQEAMRRSFSAAHLSTGGNAKALGGGASSARDHAFGARGAFEHHGAGHAQLGAEAYLGVWFEPRWGFELGAGLREGLSRDADHGSVQSRALTSAADVTFALLPRGGGLELAGKLGVSLASVRMRGRPNAGAVAAEGAGVDVHARGGFALAYALWPALALRADLAAGLPLRSIEAHDDDRLAASTGGLQLLVAVGTELRF
jgi:hypothetical protein